MTHEMFVLVLVNQRLALSCFLLQLPIAIDPTTAEVTLVGILDFESSGGRLEFVAIASDMETPYLSSETILEVIVLNVNDLAPEFGKSKYSFRIQENVNLDTFVGKISATDADTVNLKFSLLTEMDDLPFRVEETSGDIYTSRMIDRETNAEFIFQAIVSDGSSFSTADIEVSVIDVNDNNPQSDIDTYRFEIPELQSIRTVIGSIGGFDNDATSPNNQIGFKILAGNLDAAFEINSETGVLSIKTQDSVDILKHPVFNLTIEVFDKGQTTLTGFTSVEITLIDQNNNGPEFLQDLYEVSIPENLRVPALVLQAGIKSFF